MKVSRKIEWCFEGVLRVLQENFKVVSMKFQGCLEGISRVFQGSFNGVLRKVSRAF